LLFSRFGTNDCLTGHFELEGLSSFSAIWGLWKWRFVLFTFIRHRWICWCQIIICQTPNRVSSLECDIRNHFKFTNFLAEVLNVTAQNYKAVLSRYDFIGILKNMEAYYD
jgi:hypothetical protein